MNKGGDPTDDTRPSLNPTRTAHWFSIHLLPPKPMLVLNQTENTTEETTYAETEFTLSDLIGFNDVMRQLDGLSAYKKESNN